MEQGEWSHIGIWSLAISWTIAVFHWSIDSNLKNNRKKLLQGGTSKMRELWVLNVSQSCRLDQNSTQYWKKTHFSKEFLHWSFSWSLWSCYTCFCLLRLELHSTYVLMMNMQIGSERKFECNKLKILIYFDLVTHFHLHVVELSANGSSSSPSQIPPPPPRIPKFLSKKTLVKTVRIYLFIKSYLDYLKTRGLNLNGIMKACNHLEIYPHRKKMQIHWLLYLSWNSVSLPSL